MSPRRKVREQRSAQILEAATAVFARRGFAATRMDDIALEAGLSKAALYLYFSSKDAVIAALLEQYFAHGLSELAALRASSASARAVLLEWSRRRAAELQADALYLGIGYEFWAVAAREPAVRHTLQVVYRQYRDELAALLGRGTAAAELPVAAVQDTATAIVALLEGLAMMWMLEPDAVDLSRAAERALTLLLGGLTSAPTAKGSNSEPGS